MFDRPERRTSAGCGPDAGHKRADGNDSTPTRSAAAIGFASCRRTCAAAHDATRHRRNVDSARALVSNERFYSAAPPGQRRAADVFICVHQRHDDPACWQPACVVERRRIPAGLRAAIDQRPSLHPAPGRPKEFRAAGRHLDSQPEQPHGCHRCRARRNGHGHEKRVQRAL